MTSQVHQRSASKAVADDFAPVEVRVQLGCGPGELPGGWIHTDGSWNARLSQYPRLRRIIERLHVLPGSWLEVRFSPAVLVHDLRRPLPFDDGTVSAIYGSHVLEHLYHDDAMRLLRESYRVLQPGGVVRWVVPDLKAIVEEYEGGGPFIDTADHLKEMSRAELMNHRLGFRPLVRPSGNVLMRLYAALNDFHLHKFMWDEESLILHLARAGFADLLRMDLHVSRIEGIGDVEQPGRVLHGQGVCIEGIKPQRHS